MLKVLIIEDNKHLQRIYWEYLKEKGFEPEICSLQKDLDFQLEKTDVVISDWKLEEMGIRDAKFIIERALGKEKKVIIVSGEIDQIPKKIREKVHLLKKPISWLELENLLTRISAQLFKQELKELFEPL